MYFLWVRDQKYFFCSFLSPFFFWFIFWVLFWELSLKKAFCFLCRKYNQIFSKLAVAELEEISHITGCSKPCKYKKYRFLGEREPSSFQSEHSVFFLWAVSAKTKVETEVLIYPSSSLVAEFGGTLSLFLGFSFIALWDNFSTLKRIRCLLN